MGGPSIGSFAVLVVFYALIQCMIWCMALFYKDGIYRYEHIENVAMHNTKDRVAYFQNVFDIEPSVSLSMELYESSTSTEMTYDKVTKSLHVNECATFIDPDIGREDCEWSDFLYCIEYETNIDFVGRDQRTEFEEICADFIKANGKSNCFHSFDVKVEHPSNKAYDAELWCGFIVIVNSSKWSVDIIRFCIKLLNVLCLSVLYKVPLYFVKTKKLKNRKFLGFTA